MAKVFKQNVYFFILAETLHYLDVMCFIEKHVCQTTFCSPVKFYGTFAVLCAVQNIVFSG